MEQFLEITSQLTTGTLGSLPRGLLIVTRETVTGFTPDSMTGLYKINTSDYEAFKTSNTNSLALIDCMDIVFNQVYKYPHVFILSVPTGVTSELLTKANLKFREFSFITIADKEQCAVPASNADYLADLTTLKDWNVGSAKKIIVHTISLEEVANAISLPEGFDVNGIFRVLRIKTLVSNTFKMYGETKVYHNVVLAYVSFCINGTVLARSWGSFSDAHDLEIISPDSYSNTVRSFIDTKGLAQYNSKKDRTGKNFLFDTLMNKPDYQIESLTSLDFIEDFVYVKIANETGKAGFTGLANDDSGIQFVVNQIRLALAECFALGLILAKENNALDATVSFKTATEVSIIEPTWQTTGKWIPGLFVVKCKPFGAAHYMELNFIF